MRRPISDAWVSLTDAAADALKVVPMCEVEDGVEKSISWVCYSGKKFQLFMRVKNKHVL